MSIFSAFKGIIIVDSHWFRCPRIIVVFVSSSALLSYFTFTAMTSRRYLSQIHYSIEGHYSLLPPPPPLFSFDRLNNIIGNDNKVPLAAAGSREQLAFHSISCCQNLGGNRLSKGRCIQRATPLPVSGMKGRSSWQSVMTERQLTSE